MAESKCDHVNCNCTVMEHSDSPSFCSDYCRHRGPGTTHCDCGHPECTGGPKEAPK